MRRARVATFGVLVAAASLLTACTGGSSEEAAPPSSAPRRAVAGPGPFEGERWSGGSVASGSLLHDDRRSLWAVDPATGAAREVWAHPTASVTGIAAAPDGTAIALTVDLGADTASELSSALYLLDADGSIREVDRVDGHGQLLSPVFLRTARERPAVLRLYWSRAFDRIDATTGAPAAELWTVAARGGRTARVAVGLRHGEAPGQVDGYPGGILNTLTVARADGDPTVAEVVSHGGGRAESATSWLDFHHRADTDAVLGSSWLTPRDYVVAVKARDDLTGRLTLRHFVATCEVPWGYLVAYDGTELDDGTSGRPWAPLPVDDEHLLVLRRGTTTATDATWTSLDLTSGELQPTSVMWSPGPWTAVRPDVAWPGASDCDAFARHPERRRAI